MDQMGKFLADLVAATAGAAAGAAGAAVGGPVAGAAASVATTKAVSAMMVGFVGAQGAQIRLLESMDARLDARLTGVESSLSRMESRLGQVQSGLAQVHAALLVQRDEPWKSALTHLDHAADPHVRKSTRQEHLKAARDKLITAYNTTSADERRAIVAQRLAATALLLGDRSSAARWLSLSYPQAARLLRQIAEGVERYLAYEWTLAHVAEIIEQMARNPKNADPDLRRLRESPRAAPLRFRPGQTFLPVASDSVAAAPRRVPGVEPPSAFWAKYVNASVADREAVRCGAEVTNGALASSPRVAALRELWQLYHDFEQLRTACVRLGVGESAVPRHRLVVDLCPLAPTRVALRAA